MSREKFRLTIRHGSRVRRKRFETVDQVITAARDAAAAVRGEGPLEEVRVLRTFEPGDRVAARIEISTGGPLRHRDAGIDVMGDGRLVAYAGGLRRRRIEPREGESAFDAVRRELG